MTSINVLFELPMHIAQGLENGTYERIGGVVRKIGDKKIVVWLSEAGEKLSNESQLPSILTSPQMMMGLQVANLAVNVAGFAMIYHKLQQVERQLQGIDQKLVALNAAQSWLDKKHLLAQLAPLVSAVNTLSSVRRIEDQQLVRDKLRSADDKLDVASVYFRQVLGQMLAEKIEQERPDEFAACYRAWLMASQGSIQTMAELGEIHEAHARAEAFKLEHKSFGRDFIATRRDPLRKFSSGGINDHADILLVQLGQQCAGAHEIITGKALQLGHMKENGLKLADLKGPGLTNNDAGYVLYSVN